MHLMINIVRAGIAYEQVTEYRVVLSLNNDGDITLKTREDVTEEDLQIGKRILDRLVDEGVDPCVRRVVKTLLNYWTQNGSRPLDVSASRGLSQTLAYAESKILDGSYVNAVASYAKNEQVQNSMALLGINPDSDYEIESLKKRLETLLNSDVDVVPTDENHPIRIIRYVNAMILSDHENAILNNIDTIIKQNPVLFIAELKKLKESGSYNNYVLDKLIAQAEVWQFMQNNPKLKSFPFEDIWRFCIDIEFQKYGAYIFENEPGYMIATLKALCFGLQLKKPTYLDFIEINRKCGRNVFISLALNQLLTTKVIHSNPALSYGIYGFDTMDKEGLQDMVERKNEFFYFNGKSPEVSLKIVPKSHHLQKMDFFFQYHDKKIAEAGDNIGKRLIAHIWLYREPSLQHHFRDGNWRTTRILFESYLANDPPLPMVLFDTNTNLHVNGPVPFIKRVLSAMVHYNKTCGIDEVPLTFEDIDAMTQVSQHPFWSHYHPTEEDWQAFIAEHPLSEYQGR